MAADLLRGRSVVHYIDNLGVVGAFSKGASSIGDFDPIVHAVTLASVALNIKTWYEHVDSNANCADGGSREGVSDPVAARLGIELRWAEDPGWPVDLRALSSERWCEFARCGRF